MKKIFSVTFITAVASLFLFSQLFAQQDTLHEAKKTKKVKFVPLPVIGANPTSGFLFGLAPGAYWLMGDSPNTAPSSALGTLIYTTNKQFLFTAIIFISRKIVPGI